MPLNKTDLSLTFKDLVKKIDEIEQAYIKEHKKDKIEECNPERQAQLLVAKNIIKSYQAEITGIREKPMREATRKSNIEKVETKGTKILLVYLKVLNTTIYQWNILGLGGSQLKNLLDTFLEDNWPKAILHQNSLMNNFDTFIREPKKGTITFSSWFNANEKGNSDLSDRLDTFREHFISAFYDNKKTINCKSDANTAKELRSLFAASSEASKTSEESAKTTAPSL